LGQRTILQKLPVRAKLFNIYGYTGIYYSVE